MDDEVIFMLKHLDTALVETTIAAMGNDVDLATCVDTHAAVFSLAPMPTDGNFPKQTFQLPEGFVKPVTPQGGWSESYIQPFIVERVVLRTQKEEAKRLGMEGDFFESPAKRTWRLGETDGNGASPALLNIAMVFEPTGRAISKDVHRNQLSVWKTLQKNCKAGMGPPRFPYLIYTTNVRINTTLVHEQEKRDGGMSCILSLHRNTAEIMNSEEQNTITAHFNQNLSCITNEKGIQLPCSPPNYVF